MERYRTAYDQSAMIFTVMLTGSFDIAKAAFILQTISARSANANVRNFLHFTQRGLVDFPKTLL
jgi:hypothetical protein